VALPSDPVGRALAQLLARDRYERWLRGEVESVLEAGLKKIVTLLVTDYANLSPAALARRTKLFAQINRQLAASYGEGSDFMVAQMKSYAGIEARATIAHFKDLVADSPTAEVTIQNLTRAEVKAIAEFPIAGLGISDWFEKQASDMNAAIRGQIQLGLLNGEGPATIARRVWNDAPSPEMPGVFPRAKRSALALVRTTTTTIQAQAAYESMKEAGDEYVPAYRYVAVRDARTTPICRALDGKVFRFDDPKAKRPPQHLNCRSTIIAEVNYERLGIPKPNTLKGGLTMGSYADWLREQTPAAQNTLLGETAAGLFRNRRATLADLINADNRRLTNKALAATYGVAA
jgi:SPP1 gp7 family putative phage head morphogenesis protein